LYAGAVRFRLRRSERRPYTSVKNGFGGFMIAVGEDGIRIRPRGGMAEALGPLTKALARFLGVSHDLDPAKTTLSRADVGWVSTPINRRSVIVLETRRGRSSLYLAIEPRDHDLDRLEAALLKAGVQRFEPADG
jgi:hypothetical protein